MATMRQPAEWEPHAACWLAWPTHRELWADQLGAAQRACVELAAVIADVDPHSGAARGEQLEVLTLDEASASAARQALLGLPVNFHSIPYGDIWLRDTGPIFLASDSESAAACFDFNGWGNKYLLDHDPAVAQRIAASAGVTAREFPWVLEGGAIDVDGRGTALATRQCLLNRNRGPDLDQATVEARLRKALAIEHVVWLDQGLANDHTDGHVDMVARFVAPGVVACMDSSDATDPSHAAIRAAVAQLSRARDADGRRLELVCLPAPGPIPAANGDPLPASYVNFYIANTTVAVPIYGLASDAAALEQLAELFATRRVVGVDASALLTGGGALHCITQQQPLPPRGQRS